MIPVAGTQRIKRTTQAAFVFEDKDGRHEQQIDVEFVARSLPQIRAQRERNLQQGLLVEERERLRVAMVAATEEMETAKAAAAEAKAKDKLVAMEKANVATRKAVEAMNAFNDKAKEIAMLEPVWLSVSLAETVVGLPHLEDPLNPGQPFGEVTPEKLELLAIENLEAIEKAVEEGVAPKSQPSK